VLNNVEISRGQCSECSKKLAGTSIVAYQMTVHPFGTVLSLSCSTFTLSRTEDNNRENYGSAVAGNMSPNSYTDHCFCSVSSETKAEEQVQCRRFVSYIHLR